ncbi:MAG: hypothetical protein IKS02_03450, partial [Fibrobacter sp.]|nr:hypothetical protein [Fibrobacter sp.]
MKKSLTFLALAATAVMAQDVTITPAPEPCIELQVGDEAIEGQCYKGLVSWDACFKKQSSATGPAPADQSAQGFWQYWEQTECITASNPESSSSEEPESSASEESSSSGEPESSASETSSASEESSASVESSATVSTGPTPVFDNFEDGNATAENVAEDAYWYIYKAGGTVTNTQDATLTWDMIDSDGSNSYASMKGISGITSGDTTYPSVGVGVDFGMGALANCTAISYKYKGSGHHLRGLVDGVTKDKGYEHVAPNQPASSSWATVTVSVMTQPDWVASASPSDVKTFSWATVKGLAW